LPGLVVPLAELSGVHHVSDVTEVATVRGWEVPVQHDRIEIDTVWPHDGASPGIHPNLTKEVGIVEGLEDGAHVAPRHELPLLDEAIVEAQTHDVRPRDLHG